MYTREKKKSNKKIKNAKTIKHVLLNYTLLQEKENDSENTIRVSFF